MTESLIRELRALCANGFTGTITLHIEHGAVKKVEQNSHWRPKPDDGMVDLSEGRGGRVDSGHG